MGWHRWWQIDFSKDSALGLCFHSLRWLFGLRASPQLLLIVCVVQLLVLSVNTSQLLSRTECDISLPSDGPVLVLCETCRYVTLDARSGLLSLIGAAVICVGILAARKRDATLLYIYGSSMIFFASIVGFTAVLIALEAPVLEVAVEEGAQDENCIQMASSMLYSAREHAAVAVFGCVVDLLGAVLAIRSKELFTYEAISASHAVVNSSQPL